MGVPRAGLPWPPQIRDGFKVDIAPLDPTLKPEKARSNEIGFDYVSGGWLLYSKYYRSTIQDAIGDPEPRPRIYENAGDLESRGYLLESAYRWSQLRVA
ncbi:TonB-dependent receptor [Halopseudomonas pachastrellae]|nr:TonB-dependent receptor [Halopseudomonas pachastrellae]